MASLLLHLAPERALEHGAQHEQAKQLVELAVMNQVEDSAVLGREIYKVRARSKRTIYIRLRSDQNTETVLTALQVLGTARALTETEHAQQVAQDDALKAERAAQATVASASHAKMPEMVGTLMGWIGEGAWLLHSGTPAQTSLTKFGRNFKRPGFFHDVDSVLAGFEQPPNRRMEDLRNKLQELRVFWKATQEWDKEVEKRLRQSPVLVCVADLQRQARGSCVRMAELVPAAGQYQRVRRVTWGRRKLRDLGPKTRRRPWAETQDFFGVENGKVACNGPVFTAHFGLAVISAAATIHSQLIFDFFRQSHHVHLSGIAIGALHETVPQAAVQVLAGQTLDECKRGCETRGGCRGVEYDAAKKRCDLWSSAVGTTNAEPSKQSTRPVPTKTSVSEPFRWPRHGHGRELGRVLEALDDLTWTDERLDQILREADANRDGKIQYGEFVRWLFSDGSGQAAFCRTVKDLSNGLRFQVEALVGLRELCAVPEAERRKALESMLSVLQKIVQAPWDVRARTLSCNEEPGRGCDWLFSAAGFIDDLDELSLPSRTDPSWLVEELLKFQEKDWDLSEVEPPEDFPEHMALPPVEQGAPPRCRLFLGVSSPTRELEELMQQLKTLPEMDKRTSHVRLPKTMGGKCIPQTLAMEDFMMDEVGMKPLAHKYFVQGVKAFELPTPLHEQPEEKELVYKGVGQDGLPCSFKASVKEVKQWQSSFRTYYAADIYQGEEGKDLVSQSLQGKSEAGEEAWKMKFAIRCSNNPVIMRFDGRVIPREVQDEVLTRIWLVSVCGIDFASRVHDHVDLTHYIKNWKEVYIFDEDGYPSVKHGRDFELSGKTAQLNVTKTLFDMKKMCRLRLRAQDDLGIRVVVEVGLGLGVFAGDAIGIGHSVRQLSAMAVRKVLEEETFKHICLVVLSLPIFYENDTYDFYEKVFGEGYEGNVPVLLMDQELRSADMHAIAVCAAKRGFTVGELNPADSHGVFGEYWQNFGPGTEERDDGEAVNPCVTDKKNYVALDVPEPTLKHIAKNQAGRATHELRNGAREQTILVELREKADALRIGCCSMILLGALGGGRSTVDEQMEAVSVLFALCTTRGSTPLGLAYVDLDAPRRTLWLSEVTDPEFQHVDRLKHQLLQGPGCPRSGLCLVPSRSPAELLACAAKPIETPKPPAAPPAAAGAAPGAEPFPVATLKASDFGAEGARRRLGEVWQSLAQGGNHNPRSLFAALNDNEQMLRAGGGLLRFLEQNGALLGELQNHGPSVQDIRLFSPDDTVFIDAQTMMALQVFQEQQNLLMRVSNKASEGLSVYSLLEPLVASTGGQKQLRRWLRQPSRRRELLEQRQEGVQQLVALLQGSGAELVRQLHRELRMTQELPKLLSRMHRCYNFDNMVDWRSLVTSLGHMSTALEILQKASRLCDQPVAAFTAGKGLMGDISAAERVLQRVVDWERRPSPAEGDLDASLVHVQSGIDPKLDDLRRQYAQLEPHLSKMAGLERRRLKNRSESIVFHYFPQLGFHASLPNPTGEESLDALRDAVPLPAEDWHFQFAGYGRLFYKCDLARRLDCEVGDLVVDARGVELEILMQLLERLRALESRLRSASELLAEVDVLMAFAAAALQWNWVRPKLVEDAGRLHIVKGRHPLVEATAPKAAHGFVANSTELGLEEKRSYRVQVITGANLSGKSVYLKQVGLITYLAHIGSFVPAEEAQLGLCDFIFSRIQSCETATAQISSFALDLSQLSLALKHATRSSLVLLDEFGQGTRAADGVALLGAAIEHFCRWRQGPKVLVATHFTEIFRLGLVSEEEEHLQVSHLRVLPQDSEFECASSIAYLYQLVPGCASKSFGLECARKAGLSPEVLQRAQEVLDMIEQKKQVPVKAPAEQQHALKCRKIVQRFRALDLENEEETMAFMVFLASQAEEMPAKAALAGG
ncbi:unnamed protein product [Durusdinium trenchii]|uniref:EF-hand domain-containing protein n=1 Tax=Durusdinium trenchii TaxID=1381693 RepID=A0ABP0INQ5_9DINO